jgi:hypothetical protein
MDVSSSSEGDLELRVGATATPNRVTDPTETPRPAGATGPPGPPLQYATVGGTGPGAPVTALGVPELLASQYRELVRPRFHTLLNAEDGAAQLVSELRTSISPQEVVHSPDRQREWELCGLFYMNQGRLHEALAIFHSLYDHILAYQLEMKAWAHKGMPLVYSSDCYDRFGCPVLAKRYLMLTVCEDAIRDKGRIPGSSGVYFRMVWRHGVSHEQLNRYAAEIWELFSENTESAIFPEWILQELDDQWMTEYPSSREAGLFVVTTSYARRLLDSLGAGDGQALERLGHYLLNSIPGCRAYRRQRSHSTDYDIVCAIEGVDIDFRSDLGRYIICECKDWKIPANFTAFAKFCRVLDSAKCRFGILFSKNGITGEGHTTDAAREQVKVYQDRGMVIIVVSEVELKLLASGTNLITLLRQSYERVRLDLK